MAVRGVDWTRPLMRLWQGRMTRATRADSKQLSKWRKLMRQLMQGLEENSTAWDSTQRARGDEGDRGERLSA